MKRVLVPLDGTKSAELALTFLKQVLAPGEIVALLWVGKPQASSRVGSIPAGPLSGGVEALGGVADVATSEVLVLAETRQESADRQIGEAREYLEGLAESLRARGLWVTTHARLDERPADAIVEFARGMKPTFIVMLRRSHFGLNELLFGSVATRLVEAEVAPVLFVPAGR